MTDLTGNVAELRGKIRNCTLCPRRCGVDRTAGDVGACGIGAQAVVASLGPHFGEEPPLVGLGGSGTIFLAGCNLDCVFCQNSDISHSDRGRPVTPAELSAMMLSLEDDGCENVNFVTPTHVAHAVAEAIVLARADGLSVPVVYNCGGYESVDTLRLLAGLVEIYMPDFKYADAAVGERLSGVADYPQAATAALAEMYAQVGPLTADSNGLATLGLLVRHLVLPGDLARSREVIDIVADVAPGSMINVMGQYTPAFRADRFCELLARPRRDDINSLRRYAHQRRLMRAH